MIEANVGFVYQITDKKTKKSYIGKKLFKYRRRKPPRKGMKRGKRLEISSDWLDYYGSSKTLSEDVEKFGKERFTRTILRLCKTRAEMNYFEAKYQFEYGVLLNGNWYNEWIMVRVRRTNLT